MNKRQALFGMRQLLQTGYEHMSRKEERENLDALLLDIDLIPQLSEENTNQTNQEGPYTLSEQPLRNIKNMLICAVALTCRQAIDLGADEKSSFALSDYYINQIEQETIKVKNYGWVNNYYAVIRHYALLVQEGRNKDNSLLVARAIQYIRQHLYEKCRVDSVAKAVGVHPDYLSARFKTELGESLSVYIRRKKMEEAKKLLQDTNHTISEISELLGYCSVSYFSKVYRQVYAYPPKEQIRG